MELFQTIVASGIIIIIGYTLRVIIAVSQHVQPGATFSIRAHVLYEANRYLHWFLPGLFLLIIGLLGINV